MTVKKRPRAADKAEKDAKDSADASDELKEASASKITSEKKR